MISLLPDREVTVVRACRNLFQEIEFGKEAKLFEMSLPTKEGTIGAKGKR